MATIDLSKDYEPVVSGGKNQRWFINMLNKRSPTLEDWMKFEEEMHKAWIENDPNSYW
jgi:hypothetical protein